ncbi:hypothetical protein AB835_09290 [Candidatus Endobugula sertula]|uniref:Uncharacterized protein n=1 Tax=Candidatus Endobugula sertula TaxID=62101 RepID=A0A1D2QP67_9GAMM|nr:hypothetical protein AB835_09290 [Candidatus Endobugula sertula]
MNIVARQEVNLLQNIEKIPVPIISFSILLLASFLLSTILAGILWFDTHKLAEINKDIAAIEKNNMFQKSNIVNTNDISKYQKQLKALEKQLLRRYQLWADYQKITASGKEGFSTHFYHIANLVSQNLSLYEIDIYNKGKNLSLSGYAKKAEDIPIYINDLKKQKEFSDVIFGHLLIENLVSHNAMKFSLEKLEEDGAKFEIEGGIDADDLINMPLANQLDLSEMLKKIITNKE